MARAHHYLFAHRETRLAFFREPEPLLASLRSDDGPGLLVRVWDAMGADLATQGKEALASEGLAVSPSRLGERDAAVITLPTPAHVSEAWFVALVAASADDGPRYLTLEKSVDLAAELAGHATDVVMLCEWSAQGTHLNYGPRTGHTLERFEAEVEAKLG